jgi:hypothetical protein
MNNIIYKNKKTIKFKLTQNKIGIIDAEDWDKIKNHNWYTEKGNSTFYVVTNINKGKHQSQLRLHRLITNENNPEVFIDHKDFNGLNNKKNNLRKCTRNQNLQHSRKYKNTKNKFKGVCLMRTKRKEKVYFYWVSQIRFNKKLLYLGTYKTELDAALAYNNKAKELFGDFALLNTIQNNVRN